MKKSFAKCLSISLALALGISVSKFNAFAQIYNVGGTTDKIYSDAYAAVVASIGSRTQKSINDARIAIDALRSTDAAWAVGEFSKQVDQVQQSIVVNIINDINIAQSSLRQVDINKARSDIDPNLCPEWRNSYSSYLDTIEQKMMKNAYLEFCTAAKTGNSEDKVSAYKDLSDIAKSIDSNVSKWAKDLAVKLSTDGVNAGAVYTGIDPSYAVDDMNKIEDNTTIMSTNIGTLNMSKDGKVLFGIKDVPMGATVGDVLYALSISPNCTATIEYSESSDVLDMDTKVEDVMVVSIANNDTKKEQKYTICTNLPKYNINKDAVIQNVAVAAPELTVKYGTPEGDLVLAQRAKVFVGGYGVIYCPIVWDSSSCTIDSNLDYSHTKADSFVVFSGHVILPDDLNKYCSGISGAVNQQIHVVR